MPPVTIGFATSGGVWQLCRTGCLGDSVAFGLAVYDFGAKPVAKTATGATPPVCTASKPTSGLSREKAFCLPGKGWCRVWHLFVSALTGYRAGRFPAWEQPPGNLHTPKLSLQSTSKSLGHLRLSWPALFLFVGSWLPCGLSSRKCSSFQRIYYSDSATGDWSQLSSENWNFSSRFTAASSSFCLCSSLGVAGSTSSASSRLACSTDYCHCLPARCLHARTSSHSAQQLAKLRATW